MLLTEISSYVLLHASTAAHRGNCVYDGRANVALNELSAVFHEARGIVLCAIVSGYRAVDGATNPGVVGGNEGKERFRFGGNRRRRVGESQRASWGANVIWMALISALFEGRARES